MQMSPYAMIIPSLFLLASGGANAAESLMSQTVRDLDGQRFTFSKYASAEGEIRNVITDAGGRVVREADLPKTQRSTVAAAVISALRTAADSRPFKVDVALDLPTRSSSTAISAGAEVMGGIQQRTVVNGAVAALPEWEKHEQRVAVAEGVERKAIAQVRAQKIREWAARLGFGQQKGVLLSVERASDSVTLELTAAQLKRLLARRDPLIAGIELHEEPVNEITEAMVATSITASALPNASTRGSGIGVYMTEISCPDEYRITNYTRLSGTEDTHSRNVGAIVRAVSPSSWLYCRAGSVLPTVAELTGINGHAPIYIVTNSTGSNATTSYNTRDRDWDNFIYNNNVQIFKSAGNEGSATGNVTSPGKGLNIIAVGNYNDATNTISGTSSYVNPETDNEKPEVVAPGTNITAGGLTLSGTSMAAPHAAAFTADMMSSSTYLKSRPYLVKAKLLAGGTDVIAGGADKTGTGGIDFASAQWSGNWQYYTGNNASFATFDSGDGAADGFISKVVSVPAGFNRVRVVLSWINRGTWTYDHRADANPIGMDLDLSVYGPTGAYVGGSASFGNPYESVQFTPTAAGNYTFKIKRYANRDTSSDLRIGLYVNYFNL